MQGAAAPLPEGHVGLDHTVGRVTEAAGNFNDGSSITSMCRGEKEVIRLKLELPRMARFSAEGKWGKWIGKGYEVIRA